MSHAIAMVQPGRIAFLASSTPAMPNGVMHLENDLGYA